MKKLTTWFLLIFILNCLSISAKTYYYKYIESVDYNGVKSIRWKKGYGIYITFTDNGCYESDENGCRKTFQTFLGTNYANFYQYIGKKNNINTFMYKDPNPYNTHISYYYFSSDYNRLNEPCGAGIYLVTDIYVRSIAPDESSPDNFY